MQEENIRESEEKRLKNGGCWMECNLRRTQKGYAFWFPKGMKEKADEVYQASIGDETKKA